MKQFAGELVGIGLVLILVGCLSGCSTFKSDTFANRIATTAACDEVFLVSNWGFFSFSSKIDERDLGSLPCKQGQAAALYDGAGAQVARDQALAAKVK